MLLLVQVFRQLSDEFADFIAHPAIMLQRLLFRSRALCKVRWVVEPDVHHFGLAGKLWAHMVGRAANRDNVIERDLELIERLRTVPGDVDTCLCHHFDCQRI